MDTSKHNRIERGRGGFTFIELMVVIAIIAAIAAMAMPRLLPILIYSTHEGAARHLVNYGRSAIAHATLTQETITVIIDLDKQEYWTQRWPEPEEDPDKLYSEQNEENAYPEDDMELFRMTRDELLRPEEERSREEGDALINEQTGRMTKQFNSRARQAMTARARRVVHNQQGVLSSIDDRLFEEEFRFDNEGQPLQPETVKDPLLTRTRMPDGVYIEYVELADTQYTDGIVEIEIGSLGLGGDVQISIVNEDGDVYLIKWNPVTGDASFVQKGVS